MKLMMMVMVCDDEDDCIGDYDEFVMDQVLFMIVDVLISLKEIVIEGNQNDALDEWR